MTVWRPAFGLPMYEVSSAGEIRSRWSSKRRILRGTRDKDGYVKMVLVMPGGARRTVRRAVAVAEAFYGPRPLGKVACHINNVRADDRCANLRWGTQAENIDDKRRHGTAQIGERHPRSKLTEEAVREIRRREAPARVLALKFGVKMVTIYAVLARRLWAHV